MYQNDLLYATCVFLLEEKKKYTFNNECHRAESGVDWTCRSGDFCVQFLSSYCELISISSI